MELQPSSPIIGVVSNELATSLQRVAELHMLTMIPANIAAGEWSASCTVLDDDCLTDAELSGVSRRGIHSSAFIPAFKRPRSHGCQVESSPRSTNGPGTHRPGSDHSGHSMDQESSAETENEHSAWSASTPADPEFFEDSPPNNTVTGLSPRGVKRDRGSAFRQLATA